MPRTNRLQRCCILGLFAVLNAFSNEALTEDERISEYNARNYTWPPKIAPDTPGWNKLMMRRFRQLEFVEDADERYNGYFHHVASAYVVPNFTENGWGLTKAPDGLVDELRQALKVGIEEGPGLEASALGAIEIESEASHPLFVDTDSLNEKVLVALQPFHEEWSGVPLVPANAYGLRIYRNGSHLNMHVDKCESHIISSILHVDHDNDPDSEPWPIVIEDFQGNTNEVYLESGDMLFYESSKCVHGRPRRFTGKWYSSIFLHYYPADWNYDERILEGHYGIPQHWYNDPPREEELDVEPLQIAATCLKEPTCKDNWCALEDSIKWHGPATYGSVLTTSGVTHPLHAAFASQYYRAKNGETKDEL